MINLYSNPTFFRSINNYSAISTNPIYFKGQSNDLGPDDETAFDYYYTMKKIKQAECIHRAICKKGAEMKERVRVPIQKQKTLMINGHCYNLTGFSNKSCNNIKIVAGKRKYPAFDEGNFDQYLRPQNSINTLSEGNFLVNNHTLEVKVPVHRMTFNRTLSAMNHQFSKVWPESYQNMASYQPKVPFHESEQINKPINNQAKLAIHQPIQPYVNQQKPNKLVKPSICDKPLSKTAQAFIEQKAIKNQEVPEKSHKGNNVTEIKATDLAKVNASLDFSYSTFNLRIEPKRRNYTKMEEL